MATKVKDTTLGLEPERAYTYEEIAELCGASPRMVRRWCDDRRIGYVRLPRGRRILGRQYAAFVAGNVVDPEGG